MKKQYRYSLREIAIRLLKIASVQKRNLILAALSSVIGNGARLTLMGTGAALILCCAGLMPGDPWNWGGGFVLSAVTIAVMRYVEGVSAHVAAYTLLAQMRTDFFHKLRQLAPACLIDRERGDIISIAISDIDTIEKFFAHTIGPLFTVILMPLATLIYAGTISWQVVVLLLPIYVMVSVVVPLVAIKAGRGLGIRYRTRIGDMKSLILESVYGLRDIQIFGVGERRIARLEEKSENINALDHWMTFHKQMVDAVPHVFIYSGRIVLVFTVLWLQLSDIEDRAAIIVLSFIVSASFASTQSLISVVTNLLETFAAAQRLFDIYDEPPAVVEAAQPQPLYSIGDISFENVSFRYRKDTDYVLKGADLTVKKGEKLGIIGPSGVGKSTVLRLLLRFWNPVSGTIKLDVTPLSEVKIKNLRSRIALMEQQTFIFDDTAAANIALGKPDASIEEIRQAAQKAGISQLIERLPQGYDTKLGEFGNYLSGGERQRIGFARILLVNPEVIVMDEPTSSLDIFNEKILLKTLEKEHKDKTVIIVTHRKSTLTGVDRVLRIENGRFVEVPLLPA